MLSTLGIFHFWCLGRELESILIQKATSLDLLLEAVQMISERRLLQRRKRLHKRP